MGKQREKLKIRNMKLLIVTAIKVFEKEVKRMFKKAGINIFSFTDINGYRDLTEQAIESNWFGSEMNENESLMFYSFASQEKQIYYLNMQMNLMKPKKHYPKFMWLF